ncbi:hypothetical protein [Absicoccus intestinalis]|uniref:Minor capsid protein n=1 Tax=Absicoccus intestinalis TaxID=2926319 RepID=A0ABU4WMX7_9FIRM|nr:hypothetical protein [Absicoccus sp. CLA-KB-P134]MDX8417919.1 hypothetical protein [Absicoccus sp. CLA-KB-P134]
MRYDTPILFRRLVAGAYDPDTGDYADDTYTDTKVYGSVMDTNTQTMNLVYGGIRQGSLTVHIQNHIDVPFDQLIIGNKKYRVDYSRRLRTKQSFIVSEVQ